jgi:hypothetical protein
MAVFIKKKTPVTRTNSYETIKNASILMKVNTKVNWTFASVILNFL